MAAKNLVIVESPAKTKTISKFLGKDYVVKASYGHIRDLPKSTLGFDANNNFKPDYQINSDKRRVVSDIKSYIDKDTVIWIASDDDREGEAIGWHLIPSLKVQKNTIKRIVFHEITKDAVLHALANPREIDQNLVDAQQARRILDRAVGYKLSPLLWKKVKYGLSAGRVQSVALRIIVDKEKDILAFDPKEFWKLKLDILSDPKFKAELLKIDGKITKVKTKEETDIIIGNCKGSSYILDDIEEKDSERNPPPPFTTSTIQQEASRKCGFGVKETMSIAQKLYEGSVSIPGHSGGLITYMRTDSINLSTVATTAAKEVIIAEYGHEFTIPFVRKYTGKGNTQDAHEAIRPVNMKLKPSDIRSYLDNKQYRLYSLIWKRTMATQMAKAKVANTTYRIKGGDKGQYEFVSKGTKILFPGFMKAYTEGTDDPDTALEGAERFLPNVPVGTEFKKTTLTGEQNFTKPPSRYTEASLVKKLETEGIGRPSTYASTIATIITREYVERTKDKKLAPTMIGTVVTDFLIEHFPQIVDLKFTAKIENEFDKIADGNLKWQTVMHDFYDDFAKTITHKEKTAERAKYSDAITLGNDPKTGMEIFSKTGQYGSFVQIGEKDKEKNPKPKVASIPKGVNIKDVKLEDALLYLTLPRILGKTKDGEDIKAALGMFGPYLQVKKTYYSLKEDDVYTIALPRAKEIIKEMDAAKAKALLWTSSDGKLKVIVGKFSTYLNDRRKNGKAINHKLKIPDGILITKTSKEEDILSYIIKKAGKYGKSRK